MIDDKLLKFHSDAIDFIYNEMKGKEYCDKLFLNDLLEKGIVLPGYKIPYNMIEKWYEAYNAIMRFLEYNKY